MLKQRQNLPADGDRTRNRLRYRIVLSIMVLCLSFANSQNFSDQKEQTIDDDNIGEKNCTNPAIEEFPRDFMDPMMRKKGGIVAHFVIGAYLILAIGIVCDDYFVPVLEIICEKLRLKPDVAGATFMAAGTSSPEFFANIMGTFITKSDLGIGTIVGSAVFNIFGVIAVCGLFAGRKIVLDWYPITRDCIIYGFSVIILIIVLIDEKVHWYESLIMVVCYFGYILLMFLNPKIEDWSHEAKEKIKFKVSPNKVNEASPLKRVENGNQNGENAGEKDGEDGDDDEEYRFPWQKPEDAGFIDIIWWILFLPMNMIFFLTIPDVRLGPKWSKFFPISFACCMAWIGIISYVVTWMITIIGFTLAIPDSVMGLTFLALGTSIPEIISSLIVCRQGLGSMAVSNSIGSNTFDILVCLGVPWLVKSILQGTTSDSEWLITVKSEGLAYTVISLLLSLIILYLMMIATKFVLSKTLGVLCLVIYSIFLTVSIMFEMNVFFPVNLPMCKSDF